jgi:hypothetical protein
MQTGSQQFTGKQDGRVMLSGLYIGVVVTVVASILAHIL